MVTLAFVLGREPHLSVAEIAAVVGDAADWEHAELSSNVLVIPCAEDVDVRRLMERLGGTVKIGDVWRSVPRDGFRGAAEAIGTFILEHTDAEQKLRFGYSVYDLGGGAVRIAEIRMALQRGARAMKEWLAARERKVRWVTSREPTLSSVTVSEQKLIPEKNGVEVLVLVGTDHVFLARTLVVQAFKEWSDRDYGRPGRDAYRGMLPPKLARMMVNIGIAKCKMQNANPIVLDPFCGSGTVLTEAMAIGIPRIIGTDVSADAIADATESIAWVGERLATTHDVTLSVCDVRRLAPCIAEQVDAVVTEPYLGPSRGVITDAHIRELRTLYISAFREFAKALKIGGRVVFVAPVFRRGKLAETFDITSDIAPSGLYRVHPFPELLREHPTLRGKESLPYARADQRIGRQVFIFERR